VRRIAALVAVGALTLGGCELGGGGLIDVQATFSDVGDLTESAPVMVADVQIGKVSAIELTEEGRALVTMSIDPDARVPQGVSARIRRTSLLGERIVDLHVPEDLPHSAPMLGDGDTIADTENRADLEDLVREGVDVLAPIAASEIATIVDEGAKGFGGQGESLGALLRNFQQIVKAYRGRTADIRGVIVSMGRFNTVLATRAADHALSVANSARAIGVLREEVDRLERAIEALERLSRGARRILEDHADEMDRFFDQMQSILDVLDKEERSINQILRWAPLHNQNTQLTEFKDFVQVYQDLIVCGLNDDPDDPARRCPEGDH
jgi:phospholipid/cholesterol/gamma-HCH transport system substrate-binding protein